MSSNIFIDLGKKSALKETSAKDRHALLIKSENDTVFYNLTLNLLSKKDCSEEKFNFKGVSEADFMFYGVNKDSESITNTKENLFFNLYGYPYKVYVNGKEDIFKFENQMVFISNVNLKPNERNSVKIYYYGLYNNQSVGLVYYSDPVDNKEYLWTQFESYDCNRMFPSFDQPNIKAKLTLTLISPDTWNLFANEKENKEGKFNTDNKIESNFEEISKSGVIVSKDTFEFLLEDFDKKDSNKTKRIMSFTETPKISCYLFALCAGEYIICENTVDPNYKIKMRVMYRDSLKQFAHPEEMLKVTMKGIEFYENYFKIDYPFNKYDQIFCPEYNMGAMENVGLVTYNEAYVHRVEVTERRRNNFAITVLHELAHMWFGNLVTMNWWNDLWLNEAFATFISHLCLDHQVKTETEYDLSWLLFNYFKGFAYKEDQAVTSHPVMGECADTDVTETNFDSITYEKGSSILKQIYYKVGHDNFGKAIHNYFSKYQYKNTEFDNFIDELEAVSPNIKDLAYNWLTKPGLTAITPEFEVKDNKISNFKIIQEACLDKFPNLQTLFIEVTLFYNGEENKVIQNIIVNASNITEIKELHGLKAPDAVLLNSNDWAYVKLILDKTSISFFKNNLLIVKDLLSRQMIYRSFFDMMRDARLSSIEFLELYINFLAKEEDEDIISPQLGYISAGISNYLPNEYKEEYSEKAFNLCIELLHKFKDNTKMIMNLLTRIIAFVKTKQHINLLTDLLKINIENSTEYKDNIKFTLNGINIEFPEKLLNQEIRFDIVKKAYASKYISQELKNQLLEQEIKREGNSDESVQLRKYCSGIVNNKEEAEKTWKKLTEKCNEESLPNMESLMYGFVKTDKDVLKEFLCQRFFEVIEKVSKENDQKYVSAFISNLSPSMFVSEEINKKMEDKANELKDYHVTKRNILESLDFMERKLKCYNLVYSYLKKNN